MLAQPYVRCGRRGGIWDVVVREKHGAQTGTIVFADSKQEALDQLAAFIESVCDAYEQLEDMTEE